MSARTQCIYVLTVCLRFAEPQCFEQLKKSSIMCYTRDCHIHLSRFSLTMNVRVLVHFMGTANHGYNEQVLMTMGVRYNQV